MEAKLLPKHRAFASVQDVDAFCGPCFHNAMEHPVAYGRREPLCWECPGSKPDYDPNTAYAGVPPAWWDRPDGDPSLEGFNCPRCTVDKGAVA
jgi:hypothetical protein